MAITINSNVSSLNAQRNLGKATNALTESYSKLSSGLRINKASDDAAGLAVADVLRADQRIAGMAIRNANDGISTINIADGAMNEISNLLVRMGELAEQSANGIYSTDQRSALSKEFEALGAEINRIADVTKFNGISLLQSAHGSDDPFTINLQVGLESADSSKLTINGVAVNTTGLSLSGIVLTTGSSLSTEALSKTALSKVTSAIATIAKTRGDFGAVQSRLNTTVSNLEVTKQNFAAAESQIRDVDVASEAAEMTRLSILQQAGASVLAQANQQPSLALSLLR
jgi:flagellin